MKLSLASETKPLGQLLRERGLISEDDLENALALQQEKPDKLGRILIDLGYVAESDVLATISDQLKVPVFGAEYPAVPIDPDRLPCRFLRTFTVLAFPPQSKLRTPAASDP